ncbi:MAG TPA: neutral zinc metallopeptidase [Acidimicrobiia bacterium]|nr:neutral zinc metallopeptidase [Acidimicrobiia bacterium]
MRCRAGFLAVVCAVLALVSTSPAQAASGGSSSSSSASYEQVLSAAITELQRYWTTEFPKLYDHPYQPIPKSRIIAARPGVKIPSCQGHHTVYSDVKGNAFYCMKSNFIAYDDASLMPQLAETFGNFAVALVLAHEWGHAIQDRAGNDGEKTIYLEQQADCFAGAFLDHVATSGNVLHLKPGDLEASLGAMLMLRDAPGESASDPSAHGSAFDRIGAFQDGFEQGPEKCASYFTNPPVLTEIPFSNQQEQLSNGDVAAKDVIPLTVNLLNDFYTQVEPNYRPLSTDNIVAYDSSKPSSIPQCGGRKLSRSEVENRVFYCIDDGYVAFDDPFLEKVYKDIGDFGVASLIANPWATYVQTIQGIPGVASNALAPVFQADCYTGGWTAALFNGALSGAQLSAGDLDETVQALLVYSRARGVSANVPITFLRIEFFRAGFLQGYKACDYQDVAAAAAKIK